MDTPTRSIGLDMRPATTESGGFEDWVEDGFWDGWWGRWEKQLWRNEKHKDIGMNYRRRLLR
jgi:hypothetical protein